MPLIAVAVAVFADVTATTALVAGTLGTFEAIGAVGATISAIGAVTGNKALSTAGLILGGVGGLGSLASAAGVIGDPSVGSIFGSDATSAADSVSDEGQAAFSGTTTSDTGDSLDLGDGASGDLINNVSSAAGTPGNAVDTAATTSAATPPPTSAGAVPTAPASTSQITGATDLQPTEGDVNVSQPTTAQPTAVNANPPIASIASGTAPGATAAATPGAAPGAPSAPGAAAPAATAAPVAPSAPSSTSGTSGIMGFLSKGDNAGLLGMGAIQAVGSLVAGATNPLTPAQINQLNAQAAQNQAAANLQTMQNTNLAQPIPTASRANSAPLGLINTPNNATANTTAPVTA